MKNILFIFVYLHFSLSLPLFPLTFPSSLVHLLHSLVFPILIPSYHFPHSLSSSVLHPSQSFPPISSSSSSRIFLGVLGISLSIMFCATFCRACNRLREQEIEREAWRRSEQDGHPRSIYFIPFPRSMSQQDSEDNHRVPQHSQDLHTPPRYSTSVYCGPPPSYNEVILEQNHSMTD